jgi:hypothetical protein
MGDIRMAQRVPLVGLPASASSAAPAFEFMGRSARIATVYPTTWFRSSFDSVV